MSQPPVTRAQQARRTFAERAAASAAAAAAAATAAGIQQPSNNVQLVQPPASNPAQPTDPVVQALVTVITQQNLQAQAALAEAQASRAAADLAAQEALAQQRRTAAGPAPQFNGKMNSIEVHRWLIALERWFEVAHIDVNDDAERLIIAPAALHNAAQTWWTSEVSSGRAATTLNTWTRFSSAIRTKFLPMDVERWALTELDTLTAKSAKIGDVADYTNKFIELDLLLGVANDTVGALSRILLYERGLPEEYRVKCAEKRHTTLAAATEAMLTLWNAKNAARAHQRGGSITLNHVDSEEPSIPHTTSEARSTNLGYEQPGSTAAELRITEKLFAMMADRFPFGGSNRGRGGYARGASNQRNERKRGRESPSNTEGQRNGSRSRSRTPGVTDEIAQARIKAGQCIRCGETGHRKDKCNNPIKTTF